MENTHEVICLALRFMGTLLSGHAVYAVVIQNHSYHSFPYCGAEEMVKSVATPNEGIEPSTTRLRVVRSAD